MKRNRPSGPFSGLKGALSAPFCFFESLSGIGILFALTFFDMKRLSLIHILLLILSTVFSAPSVSAAAPLDFGWGTPFSVSEKTTAKDHKDYLAWPIHISNRTGKRSPVLLDVVAVTDTGRQYAPVSTLRIQPPVEYQNITALQNMIFPMVTLRAVALFEDVDPKAGVIHFYIGGLLDSKIGEKEKMNYLRITYVRHTNGWVWDGSHVLE